MWELREFRHHVRRACRIQALIHEAVTCRIFVITYVVVVRAWRYSHHTSQKILDMSQKNATVSLALFHPGSWLREFRHHLRRGLCMLSPSVLWLREFRHHVRRGVKSRR